MGSRRGSPAEAPGLDCRLLFARRADVLDSNRHWLRGRLADEKLRAELWAGLKDQQAQVLYDPTNGTVSHGSLVTLVHF